MYIEELQASGFRSYRQLATSFHPKLNAIVGDNGQGKTNVLDMLYFLSMCKAPTRIPDTAAIRHGANGFALHGKYRNAEGIPATVSLGLKRGQGKELRYDDKLCPRLAAHIGKIPLVAVYPHDIELIADGGDLRRKFLNALISQFDPTYLPALSQYDRVLAQRNAYLKQQGMHDDGLLRILDAQLEQAAAPIWLARTNVCASLAPLVQRYYQLLSPEGENAELAYKSHLNDAALTALLDEHRASDLRYQYTTTGVHRDNIELRLNGYTIRREGSQGQQKAYVLALRLAQFHLLRERIGAPPIFLLDDLFDKLDTQRVEKLAAIFTGDTFGQVFVTDTDAQRLRPLFEQAHGEGLLLSASNGSLSPTTIQ